MYLRRIRGPTPDPRTSSRLTSVSKPLTEGILDTIQIHSYYESFTCVHLAQRRVLDTLILRVHLFNLSDQIDVLRMVRTTIWLLVESSKMGQLYVSFEDSLVGENSENLAASVTRRDHAETQSRGRVPEMELNHSLGLLQLSPDAKLFT
jgi:hypothetical protein